MAAAAQLASVLHTPCAAGEPCLDSAQLQKLCRDAELLNRQLTATKLDLLFAAAVGKVGWRWQWPLLSLRLRSHLQLPPALSRPIRTLAGRPLPVLLSLHPAAAPPGGGALLHRA